MIALFDSPGVVTERTALAEKDRMAALLKTIFGPPMGPWLACRLKFYFRYVLRLQKPPTPAMYSGSTVHAVLRNWNLARWRREPFARECFRTLFDSCWTTLQQGAGIQWEGKELSERASAWRALEHDFTQTPIKANKEPEAVEVRAEADLSSHGLPTLVGVLDLVRSGGRVVDFKLAGKSPDPQQLVHVHEVQLTCYSLLYRDTTGRKESGLELRRLVKTKTPKLVVSLLPPIMQARIVGAWITKLRSLFCYWHHRKSLSAALRHALSREGRTCRRGTSCADLQLLGNAREAAALGPEEDKPLLLFDVSHSIPFIHFVWARTERVLRRNCPGLQGTAHGCIGLQQFL